MLAKLNRALGHIPYAVCGQAAMRAWGYTLGPAPMHVSIVCAEHSKEVVRSWAAVHGSVLDRAKPNIIGLPTADGQIRKVRIKYLHSAAFEALEITRPPRIGEFESPNVLGLASMLDQFALAYVFDQRARVDTKVRKAIGRDIFWILNRIMECPSVRLGPQNVPHVLESLFWDVFTAEHPHSPALFARAGLVLSLVGRENEGMPPPSATAHVHWGAERGTRHDAAVGQTMSSVWMTPALGDGRSTSNVGFSSNANRRLARGSPAQVSAWANTPLQRRHASRCTMDRGVRHISSMCSIASSAIVTRAPVENGIVHIDS